MMKSTWALVALMAASTTCFFGGVLLFSLILYIDVHGPALLPHLYQFVVFLCCWCTGVGLLGILHVAGGRY